ncbi:hypothetical protein AMBR_FBHANALA_01353 [Dolosigranulum pigrum]|nr:hypothetical protein AMBR_FBHANALA_01353 [Dolosigranulum pigrum]
MQGIEPPYTDPYVRWCERSTSQLMASLLLDNNQLFNRSSLSILSTKLPVFRLK